MLHCCGNFTKGFKHTVCSKCRVTACELGGALVCYLDCMNIIRVAELKRIRWERHLKWEREFRNVYKILVGNPAQNSAILRHM